MGILIVLTKFIKPVSLNKCNEIYVLCILLSLMNLAGSLEPVKFEIGPFNRVLGFKLNNPIKVNVFDCYDIICKCVYLFTFFFETWKQTFGMAHLSMFTCTK